MTTTSSLPTDETPLAKDEPVLIAWEAYRATTEYANTRNWARRDKHTDGSLWAAFFAGFTARSKEPPSTTGLREALEQCRDKFAEYVELHRAKFNRAESPCEYEDIQHKVARNQEMVDLCNQALSSSPIQGDGERGDLYDAAFKARWFVDAVANNHSFTDTSRSNARDVARLLDKALSREGE